MCYMKCTFGSRKWYLIHQMLNYFAQFSHQFNKIKCEIHPNHKFTLWAFHVYGIFVLNNNNFTVGIWHTFSALVSLSFHIRIHVISLNFQKKNSSICISEAGVCFLFCHFAVVVIFNCMSFHWNIYFTIFSFKYMEC